MKGLLVVFALFGGTVWDLVHNNGAWTRQIASFAAQTLRAIGIL
jgi:hypothetical protein